MTTSIKLQDLKIPNTIKNDLSSSLFEDFVGYKFENYFDLIQHLIDSFNDAETSFVGKKTVIINFLTRLFSYLEDYLSEYYDSKPI
jgi:hypothetical protein